MANYISCFIPKFQINGESLPKAFQRWSRDFSSLFANAVILCVCRPRSTIGAAILEKLKQTETTEQELREAEKHLTPDDGMCLLSNLCCYEKSIMPVLKLYMYYSYKHHLNIFLVMLGVLLLILGD